jgi:protein-disulfide isomerase
MKTITTDPYLLDHTRDHLQGLPDAPIQLVEYGDFECPACGEVFPDLKRLKRDLADQLCFAFRHFPLVDKHPHAEMAAEAAEAAAAQDRFWAMHDALFEYQDRLSADEIHRVASRLGLDSLRLSREVQNAAYRDRIREDVDLGLRAPIDGTPTFYLNGERYESELTAAAILSILGQQYF